MKAGILMSVLIVCFCTSLVAGELPDSSQLKRDKFSVGFECSIMNSGSKSITPQRFFNAVANFAIPVEYFFSSHFGIASGISLIKKNSDVGVAEISELVNYDFNFIRIPVNLKYLNKIFFVGGGFVFDYYLDHNSEMEYYDKTDFGYETNSMIYGWNLNFGLEGRLYKKLFGYASVNLNYDLNNFIDKPFDCRFSAYGFSAGVKYKF